MQWTTCVTLLLMIAAASLYLSWDDVQFYKSIKEPSVSEQSEAPIDYNAPYQDALAVEGTNPIKIYDGKKEALLIPRAVYEISGLFIGKNTNFGMRKFNGIFDRISPLDIAIAWGDNANKQFIEKNYIISMEKDFTDGGRFLYLDATAGSNASSYDLNYANTHVIPANSNILNALMGTELYDEIDLTGLLVDVEINGKIKYETSLSRYDEGDGACEILYVTAVRINNKIYK